ncbi:hypothetical protein CCHR01_00437 [Colletotrichum chrysophilum]|uniref:Uncharacterized protein n=1 Tax=Colletotrichum chrysophilum TaxID=1836956 RepID=A0AAD9EM22_9PEZI|nr:hypothetical protein CCHR01_00437 [Colletotrichum chrysophilum]
MTIVEHCEELTVLEPRARLSDHAHIGRCDDVRPQNQASVIGHTDLISDLALVPDPPTATVPILSLTVLAEPDSYHAITARHHETSDYRFENLRD